MPEWTLYMIRTKNGALYTGITQDVKRRFAEHADGGKKGAKYLRGRGPLELVFQQKIGSRSQALKAEAAGKNHFPLTVELVVPESAGINIAVGKRKLSQSVHISVFELPGVNTSVGIGEDSLPVHPVTDGHALVFVAVSPGAGDELRQV